MKSTYVDDNYLYTDPSSYDKRDTKNIEKYLYSRWTPLLLRTIKKVIKEGDIVADLGCGTLIHTQHMGVAQHIYAVDVCREMLDFGLPKIESIKERVTVLCEDASSTSIPSNSCDVVWIDGLSEFVNLDKLFHEIHRILKKGGSFSIVYHNRFNPFNLVVFYAYKLLGRKGKTYRHIIQFKKVSKKYQFELLELEGKGVTFFAPDAVIPFLIPLWKMFDYMYQPLEKTFPLGHNILALYRKK
jgi:ubiquinone/menaquinone biosynthesis C-methylase UbiE